MRKCVPAGLPDFDPVQNNITVLRTILRLMGKDENDFEHVSRPARARYAVCRLTAPVCAKNSGGSRSSPTLRRVLPIPIAWYTDNRSWWEPLKAEVEAKYAKAGQ